MKPASTEGSPLRLLFWESTARCNLACAHCRRLRTAAAPNELTTAEATAVFTSAVALGSPIVVFSGGEPLLRADWADLADEAHRMGLPTALATNGTLIDAALARRIAQAGFRRVAVSLDGASAATHDALRSPGNFEKALAGLKALRAAGAAVQINATVTQAGADRLDDLYSLARNLGAEALHLFLLVPVGCGAELAPSRRLSPQRYEEVLNWIFRRQDGELEIRATCGPQYHRLAAQRGGRPLRGRGCLAGLSVAFVSCIGEVFPCGYLPVACGSVRQTPLEDIWRGSQTLAVLRKPNGLGGKCGRCKFASICGGCRARAFAETGDFLAEDPLCAYMPPE